MFNLLHIVRDLDPASGGPSRTVPQLVEAIRGIGEIEITQHLVFGERGERFCEPAFCDNVFFHQVPYEQAVMSASGTKRRLKKIESLNRVRLMHVHGLWTPMLHNAIQWARSRRIPYIVSPRGMLSGWCLNHKWLKKRIGWWLYQRKDLRYASGVHATSVEERNDIERLNLKRPVFVVPNGVRFTSLNRDKLSTKRQQALCVTRLHPVKGLDRLIDAWAQVAPSQWSLVIAGPSEFGMREKLQKQLELRGMQSRIRLLKEVDEIEKQKLYKQSSFFVLPSHSENFGMAIAEALAAGLPVIATTGTPWKVVETYRCGWIVPPTTADLVSILRVAFKTSSHELDEMGLRGNQLITDKFAWPAVAGQMVTVYKTLVESDWKHKT